MEDVMVTLLDGTKVAKSTVPEGVIYINENGVKVRKVKKAVATKPAAANPGNLLDNLKDMASKKLPNIFSSINLDEGISKLKGLKGINTQSLVDMLQKVKGAGNNANGISALISNASSGIAAQGLDLSQLRGMTSSMNMPWLDKVLDTVEGMAPNASPKKQLESYLSMAMEDGMLSEDELDQLHALAKSASVNETELQKMIKARQ